MLQIRGWSGDAHSASYSEWVGAPGVDLINFQSRSGVRVATSGDKLEAQIWLQEIDVPTRSTPVRTVIRLVDSLGHEDWSDGAANQFPAALSFKYLTGQTSSAFSLSAISHNDNITLEKLRIRFTDYRGLPASGKARVTAGGRTYPGTGPGQLSEVVFSPPIRFTPGITQNFQVSNENLGGAVAVRPALLYSDDIFARPERYPAIETSIKPAPDYRFINTITPPSGDIRIDGNFEDWNAFGTKGQQPGTVRNRNEEKDDSYPYATNNRNVDINGIQVKMTPTGGPTKLNFYVQTVGHILNGLVVDNPTFASISEPGGGGGTPAETQYLEDKTVIFVDKDPTFDLDQVTGARIVPSKPTFGADIQIKIAGKFGRVIQTLSQYYQWQQGSGWREVTGITVSAASDYHRLEASIPLAAAGISPAVTPDTYFVTTDWRANYDDTQPYQNRGATSSQIFAEERNVAPNTVLQGQRNVPILRVDVESREPLPADVTDIYATLFGTASKEELDAVRLWAGPREALDFDPDTFTEVTSGNTWDGNQVRLDLAEDILVEPLGALTLFITVDISATATTLLWFDMFVLREDGIISSSAVVATSVHDTYKLTRIWNEAGGRFTDVVGINEVDPHARQGGNNQSRKEEWVELINPTDSAVDISGWYILKWIGAPTYYETLYTVPASTSIAAGGFYVAYIGTENYINNSSKLYLYDATYDLKSYVVVGNAVPWADSFARYRKQGSEEPTDGPTTGSWYYADAPTPGSRNKEIPEFTDIIYPVMGTLMAYAFVRRRRSTRGRGEETPAAA
jgi:hypothetical protein